MKLDIVKYGAQVLTQKAQPVTEFDENLKQLVENMFETMYAAPGVGLAAPQIGVSLRVFTYHVDDEPGHLVNPVLKLEGEAEEDDEGCLSIPGLQFPTPRAPRAIATGFNMYGDPVAIEGTELLARCVQHETDHLDGILFVDRLDKKQRKLAMKAIREAEWSGQPVPEVKVSPHSTQRIS